MDERFRYVGNMFTGYVRQLVHEPHQKRKLHGETHKRQISWAKGLQSKIRKERTMRVQAVLEKDKYHTEYTNDLRPDGRVGLTVWFDADVLDDDYEVEDVILVLTERRGV